MEAYGVPAPKMDWDSSNLPDAWRRFKQHVELMFTGPLKSSSEEQKCSFLLLWIGDKGRDISNTWTLTEDQAKKLQTYYDSFSAYLTPKANPIFARYKFHEKTQASGESFEHFVTDLKLLVKDCGYDKSEEMVRDRIVFGTNSPHVREKLLSQGPELTLDKAIDIARSYELAKSQLKAMSNDNHEVHAVRHKSGKPAAQMRKSKTNDKTCTACGGNHDKQTECPAKGKQCLKCKKLNHFAKVCRSKVYNQKKTGHREVHTVQETTNDSDPELFIDIIAAGEDNEDSAFAEIQLGPNKVKLTFKLDTGAQANIVPANVFTKLNTPLKKDKDKLFGYGGHPLKVEGHCELVSRYKDKTTEQTFHIVDCNGPPILGFKACKALGLIKVVYAVTDENKAEQPTHAKDILSEYSDVFEGVGEFQGECSFRVDPNITPVVCPPRRVPFALRDRLKSELANMERDKIICKVTEPTKWVNALVICEKANTQKLRLCLDPRSLNKAIMRPYYPLPTLEDVTHKLTGAKFFSILDARSGYWAIKLSEESSLLTTFNTIFGRYRFLRLPFGIVSAQDEFQRRIDETYEGLDGVAGIVDDIIVFGKTKEEHDRNLRAMLNRTRQRGLKLNPEKCHICVTEVSFFGHKLTAEGLKPDPHKVKAVRDMKPPENAAELETILGMVNYLARFAPNLAEMSAPLRQLLRQDAQFKWNQAHEQAFQKIKDTLTAEPGPVLAYFDPEKEVTLQVDASKNGLGATVMQNGKPVAYASKLLNPTEQNYAQIEKELYAVLYGCKRFHDYIYGRHITVESDHKPLESIIRKPFALAPPRLQRMLLALQKYSITLIHKPGKEIPVADALSRKSMHDSDSSLAEAMETQVHTIVRAAPVSTEKLEDIKTATAQDEQLLALKHIIRSGWPETRKKCPTLVSEYWNHRDEITETDGLLLKGERIIIPRSLRKDMLQRIHTGHFGVEKSKHRARDIMFWPGMSKQIEETVSKCAICQTHRSSNPKEPMLPQEIPENPWQTIGTDLLSWNSENYIVICDYLSRYFELERLPNITTAAVIHKMKAAFARHGIPNKVISDNGPCYSSQEFKRFAEQWGFQHTTSSPRYPQSNGLAEKTVQTAKRILTKAKEDKKDPYLSLLEYRNTPVDGLKSPAQILMSRRLRSILPTTTSQLRPRTTPQRLVHARREECQRRQKQYYDTSTRPLPPPCTGAPIRYQQEDGKWKPATIIQPAETPRSYHIKTSDGQILRRNRRHLLSTQNNSSTANTTPEEVQANVDTQTSGGTVPETLSPHRTPVKETESCHHSKFGRAIKPRQILDL